MDNAQDRLREHPADRFAGEVHPIDLHAMLSKLRAEPHEGQRGHRQVTVFQRPPVTQALFSFQDGGVMADHAARGLVTIQGFEGRIIVNAEGSDHVLTPGSILILNPSVRHSVRAEGLSAMLLTVHLEPKG